MVNLIIANCGYSTVYSKAGPPYLERGISSLGMVFGETTQTDHSDEEAVNEVECVYVTYVRPKTALLYTDSITVHCNCQKIIHDELLQCCSLHRSEHGGCYEKFGPVDPRSNLRLQNWTTLVKTGPCCCACA